MRKIRRKELDLGQKHLKRYRELANRRGSQDPLEYLFKRFNTHRIHKNHEAAEKMAQMLVPYGHGKCAQVDQDSGETTQQQTILLLE